MENFFKDNPDILFHLKHTDLTEMIRLKEDFFKEKDRFAYAPESVEDAIDNYERVLNIIGQICGDYLQPHAQEIDEQGVSLKDNEVIYPEAINKVTDMFTKADMMGFSFPRKYGGLNMPVFVNSAAAEIISRAEGSFLNFGLHQDNGATLNKFGDDTLKDEYMPRFCTGEFTSSMVLTEPDAGSDLQAVGLTARQDENGVWRLNGVKRFITNGCARVALVLARSEEGSKDGRGLSMFLYERDEHMIIRRVENKLGIHGSPTCELQFNNAPAKLIGRKRFGLIKYTMWLMNAARLGIAGQALGIAEAAYREADKYAAERHQFDKPIRTMIPVYEMLTEMKIAIEAGRSLYYETAKVVDLKEGYEEIIEKHPEKKAEYKDILKKYDKYAALLTPITKAYNTEMSNKVTYDSIQIHGGTGYMKEFNVERHARDARITNIYEGTTQLQVVAAIAGIKDGTAEKLINEYDQNDFSHCEFIHKKVKKAAELFSQSIQLVKEADDTDIMDYHSRRLVEMATDIIMGYLLMRDAAYEDRKKVLAETFTDKMVFRVEMVYHFIKGGDNTLLKNYKELIH